MCFKCALSVLNECFIVETGYKLCVHRMRIIPRLHDKANMKQS